ncbi:hypothetical protein [Actinocorallia longicatena]
MSGAAAPGPNPFPFSGTARVGQTAVTTLTEAIGFTLTQAAGFVNGAGSGGRILAVVGGPGSGKTHLAAELHRLDGDVRFVYLDALLDGVLALYRHGFVRQLDLGEAVAAVSRHYAEVVAEELGDSPFTAELVASLRSGAADPQVVVEEIGLMAGRLRRTLRQRLHALTGDESLGAAFALLLVPDLRSSVWEWLSGNPPTAPLRERGVTASIGDDGLALTAMGAFLKLFGTVGRRLMVVVDGLDDPLPQRVRPGFRRLLDMCTGPDVFLVLCCTGEFLRSLGQDVRQRIDTTVALQPLAGPEVEQLVHDHTGGTGFPVELVPEIARLTGGNARWIIRLCHRAYELAASGEVTPRRLRRAAEQVMAGSIAPDLHGEISRILDDEGSPYLAGIDVDDREGARADFWIAVGDDGAGCAIIVSGSVFQSAEAAALESRAAGLHKIPGQRVLLVVNGEIAPDLTGLGPSFDSVPLLYHPATFATELIELVRRMTRGLEEERERRLMREIHDAVVRPQAGVQAKVQTEALVAELSQRMDTQFLAMRSVISGLVGAPDFGRSPQPLPAGLDEHFDRVLAAVTGLTGPESEREMVQRALSMDESGRAQRQAFQDPGLYTGLGAAAVLRVLLVWLRENVARWCAAVSVPPTAVQTDQLDATCKIFADLYTSIPLSKLVVTGPGANAAERVRHRDTLDVFAAQLRQLVLGAIAGSDAASAAEPPGLPAARRRSTPGSGEA